MLAVKGRKTPLIILSGTTCGEITVTSLVLIFLPYTDPLKLYLYAYI